jgi:hypothetical protein
MHSSFLLLFFLCHHPALVDQEQAVRILAVVDAEVLHTHVQLLHLELRPVGLVVYLLSAMPALDISDWWSRWAAAVLHKWYPIIAWVLYTLLSWWHDVVVEETLHLEYGLWL